MSLERERLAEFRGRVEGEWRERIAPFWLEHAPDGGHGGFRGLITNDLRVEERADKGAVLNARILWTFSRAFRLYGVPSFRRMAERAHAYLAAHFTDRAHGGVFWTVDYKGRPADARKRTYAQAFALYGLTEFHDAAGGREALDAAFRLFRLLETRGHDRAHEGYFETFERDWAVAADQRLSEVDEDEKKSMNTHLHVLEAYAALARATGDGEVRARLRALVEIFLAHIVHPSGSHLRMFFDETWACKSSRRSFGHDIEASWLLCEAAGVLGDAELSARVRCAALKLAQSVSAAGLDADGGLLYEADAQGHLTDTDKHWWPQAEAVVGFLNAYQLGGGEHFLEAAAHVWAFVERRLLDREHGEWFWKTSRAGRPARELPKVSLWKCPYHNGRMCFEAVRRLDEIAAAAGPRGG